MPRASFKTLAPFLKTYHARMTVALIGLLVCCIGHRQALSQDKPQSARPKDPLTYVGLLKSKEVSESSGLARSSSNADAFWTINDSGNSNHLFLFGAKGKELAKCKVKHAKNIDWEALTRCQIEGRSYIMIADVGDNLRRRKSSQIYCVREPNVRSAEEQLFQKSTSAVRIDFTFEGGPVNCEAVGYTESEQSVFLIEKQFAEKKTLGPPKIFQLKLPMEALASLLTTDRKKNKRSLKDTLLARPVAELPVHGVTGMAFSPDGNQVVVRTYLNFYLYRRTTNEPTTATGLVSQSHSMPSWAEIFHDQKPTELPLPLQVQGEAICFSQDGQSVIVTSEKPRQPIWKINLEGLQKQIAQDPQ